MSQLSVLQQKLKLRFCDAGAMLLLLPDKNKRNWCQFYDENAWE